MTLAGQGYARLINGFFHVKSRPLSNTSALTFPFGLQSPTLMKGELTPVTGLASQLTESDAYVFPLPPNCMEATARDGERRMAIAKDAATEDKI